MMVGWRLSRSVCIAVMLAAAVFATDMLAHADAPETSQGDGVTVVPTPGWKTFSVDVTVRRSRAGVNDILTAAGAPPMSYRYERSRATHGWKTVMTFGDTRGQVRTKAGMVAAQNTRTVHRIEDDGDGTPLRFFDAQGGRLKLPSNEQLRALTDRPAGSLRTPLPKLDVAAGPTGMRTTPDERWVESFIVKKADAQRRHETARQRAGVAAGTVGAAQRYLHHNGDRVVETLVDAATGVVTQVNVARNGELQEQTIYAYADVGGGFLARTGTRSERAVSTAKGTLRTVMTIELSNMRFGRGGAK